MPVISAGLLMCRRHSDAFDFFLVHPGGPFYRNRSNGVWTIPKGIANEDEDYLACAIREFEEETGIAPSPPFFELGSIRMKSGKLVHAWAFQGDWNEQEGIRSNTFPMEWPPKSGRTIQVPEVDFAKWCTYSEAVLLIHPSQKPLLNRVLSINW